MSRVAAMKLAAEKEIQRREAEAAKKAQDQENWAAAAAAEEEERKQEVERLRLEQEVERVKTEAATKAANEIMSLDITQFHGAMLARIIAARSVELSRRVGTSPQKTPPQKTSPQKAV